jgi:hypothetical protein
VVKPEPLNGLWVTEWVCGRVYDDVAEGYALWIRWVNGGPGWALTAETLTPPKGGGGWRLAAWVNYKTAANALGRERDYQEPPWMAKGRLLSAVASALDAERRAA